MLNSVTEEGNVNFTLAKMEESCFLERCLVTIEDSITDDQFFYLDMFYWVEALIMILVGMPLNMGMVHWEIYGGDPQKRSLFNRLSSSSIISNISAGFSIHIFTGVVR